MKESDEVQFPILENLLKQSLFSESSLPEGFSDKKALFVIDTCKKHLNRSPLGKNVELLIQDKLIEAIARNVGCGENYGFGFPFDALEKIENKLSFEIDEGLIQDILFWGYGISDYGMVTLSKKKEEKYFFQNEKEPMELVSYTTMAKLAYKVLEIEFFNEYESLKSYIINEIPANLWSAILGKDEPIEKYL